MPALAVAVVFQDVRQKLILEKFLRGWLTMHKVDNPYRPIEAEVLDVITETPTIKTIRLKPKEMITLRVSF